MVDGELWKETTVVGMKNIEWNVAPSKCEVIYLEARPTQLSVLRVNELFFSEDQSSGRVSF